MKSKSQLMKDMKNKRKLFRPIALSLSLLMLLALILSLASCGGATGGTDESYTKEEISAFIDGEPLKAHEYAGDYFDEWNFPRFTLSKVKLLERLYDKNFVDEVGDVLTRAKKSAHIFLESYYDKIDRSDVTAVTDALIMSYVATYEDPYSIYRTADEYDDYRTDMSGSFVGIGVTVTYNKTENTLTVLSLSAGGGAEAAGILPGDLIVSVDGRTLEDEGYQPTVDSIKGEEGSKVVIGIERDGKPMSFTVTRSRIIESSVTYDMRNEIMYIKITGFKRNTYTQFVEAISAAEDGGAEGIVFDLRGNPGGYLDTVVDMLSYIAPKGTEIASFTNSYDDTQYADSSHTVSLPMVVICDSNSASAAELFTAGIRDFGKMGLVKSKIVGEKSFGKGIMQDTFKFSDGSSITMTVAYYNPPLRENYHGVGVMPDIPFDFDDKDGAWRTAAENAVRELILQNK